MCGDAIESILENYNTLQQLWDDCLDTRLDPDVKGRVIGVKSQMLQYNLFFGLHLCKTILKITDNLSRTLQKQTMSAAAGQSVADLTVATLKQMHSDESFQLFYSLVDTNCQKASVGEPILPRKRKAPRWFEVGCSDGFHSPNVEDCYCYKYFEALDAAISSITDRFNQPGYAMYRNLEELLVNAARGKNYEEFFGMVVSFYKDDLKASELSVQLQNLGTWFSSKESDQATVELRECIAFLRDLSDGQHSFFSEVCHLARLILVMPATNAISERSFSAMRRLKTYL